MSTVSSSLEAHQPDSTILQVPKGRHNNFDFLRLLLAVVVIFSHSFPLGLGSESGEPFMILTRGQTTAGAVAVNCFFIISGYLITASFTRSKNVHNYLAKRFRRIYPGFITSMVFGALIILPLSGGVLVGSDLDRKLLNFFGHILQLREFNYFNVFSRNPYPNALNGSVWSIAYEFWCYLGVAILGLTGMLSRRKLIFGIFLMTILVSIGFNVSHIRISGSWIGEIFGYPPFWARLLPMYLAGVVAYLYRDRIRYNNQSSLVCFGVLFAASFIPFAWSAVFPLAGTYLLFWVAFNRSFRCYKIAKFGDFSYGTYLYAFPVQQMVMHLWGRTMNPFSLFILATPPTLLFALASWYCVERPFLGLSNRQQRGPRVPSELDQAQCAIQAA